MSPPPVESSPPGGSSIPNEGSTVRLQKVLAGAGFGSRRAGEELIDAGRVTVNGRVATLGTKVDPARDVIKVDGVAVATSPDLVYLALNKPLGMLSAMSDPSGRPCVGDLLTDLSAGGLHHVGRLDADSEGLLLVTNDGSLSHRLTHPSYGVAKRYLAEIEGGLSRGVQRRLLAGVDLDDGPAKLDTLTVVDRAPGRTLVEVEIHEGRNRILRRMFESVDRPVHRLVRIAVGPLRLGELKPGRSRRLSQAEVRALYQAVGM